MTAAMAHDDTLPPPLFDLADFAETPPVFDYSGGHPGPALTPYGRHHGLGPGVFGGNCCDEALYDRIESLGWSVWIHHLCPIVGPHDQHRCDRCDVEWPALAVVPAGGAS